MTGKYGKKKVLHKDFLKKLKEAGLPRRIEA